MDRRKSTFDSMFMSSSSKLGDGTLSAGGSFGEGRAGEPNGFEFFSCSRRKSKLDSRWVLTGRGRPDIDLDFVMGSKISMLGRPPSREGLDEDGCRAWPWNDDMRGDAAGLKDGESVRIGSGTS